MNDATFSAEPRAEEPKKKSKLGCILGGCLGVAALMIIGTGIAGYFGYRYVTQQVEKYTSETPNELPSVVYTDEQMEELGTRLEGVTGENGAAVEQVVLTSDDINALISQNEDFKDKVHVSIADGDVTAEVSVPMDMIPGGKGRFLNGSMTAHVSLDNGYLVVQAADVTVNGEKLPPQVIDALGNENLAKEANKDANVTVYLEKLEKIEIVGDQLILTPVGAGEAQDVAEALDAGGSQDVGDAEDTSSTGELETTAP